MDDQQGTALRATDASVIIDAADYFKHARRVMHEASRRIMLIGWDFDARVNLGAVQSDEWGPPKVGDFIHSLVDRNSALEVFLLRWDIGAIKSLLRGSTLLTYLSWIRHPRIHIKLDGYHPTGASHHQKLIIVDDRIAFCGGIDVTGMRWDTRDHLDPDPRRRFPGNKPYPPWHDAAMVLSGPAAAGLGEVGRLRWNHATGNRLEPVTTDKPLQWPQELSKDFSDVRVNILQTLPDMTDRAAVHEVETRYLALIAQAERYVYIESQYFCARRIAEAIAKRLSSSRAPEFVIINPRTAEGWLEPIAMDTGRARIWNALKKLDTTGRLRIYHPVTGQGSDIYVHAKIMIVDDVVLRIGSSNLNNRSMRLDTECDVEVLADAGGSSMVSERIRQIRDSLIAEHLGVAIEDVESSVQRTKSLIGTIDELRGTGKTLVDYEPPTLLGHREVPG